MTGQCRNCGGELLAGQQFCRQCGVRMVPADGEAPTRMLDGGGQSAPAPGTTALPSRDTGAHSLTSLPTEQQTPFGGMAFTSPLATSTPPTQIEKGRRWSMPVLLGLLLVVCLGGVLTVTMFTGDLFGERIAHPSRGEHAGHPTQSTDADVFDEEGAVVSQGETVITKIFEVDSEIPVSVKNNSPGNITVEGWDEARIEVRVIKRGGTTDDRRNARIRLKQTGESFALAADNSPVKIFFEVKVPRRAGRVELSSGDGNAEASNIEGALAVSLRNGAVKLENVRGPVQAKSINGEIDVVYRSAEREGTHEFATVNGDINVRLVEGMKADVKASVVNGSIDVADGLGFQAQKRKVGWQVDAPIGEGGKPLNVKTVNGSISFRK